jgi:hypothetical protein
MTRLANFLTINIIIFLQNITRSKQNRSVSTIRHKGGKFHIQLDPSEKISVGHWTLKEIRQEVRKYFSLYYLSVLVIKIIFSNGHR